MQKLKIICIYRTAQSFFNIKDKIEFQLQYSVKMRITFNFESFFRVIVNSRNKWFVVILIATLQDVLNLTKADTIQGKKIILSRDNLKLDSV